MCAGSQSVSISDQLMKHTGLQAGQATAKPKPVFARLEGEFVTTAPDAPAKMLASAKA